MPRRVQVILAIPILLFLLGIFPVAAEGSGEVAEHIFIISVDGLNNEAFISTALKNMRHLAGEGMLDEKCLAMKTDTGEAAQASLLTGARPEQHKYYSSGDRLEMASILDVLKKNQRTFWILDGSGGKLKAFDYGAESYQVMDSSCSDSEVFQQAIKVFGSKKNYFNYIFLNDCMNALLSLDDKRYYQAVADFDKSLGDFIAYLRNEKLYYKSLIIVVCPRSSSPSNTAPLIIHGPGIKTGGKISESAIIDITPTVCHVAGLKTPYGCRGIPLYEAMILTPDSQDYIMGKWLKQLKSERIANWQQLYEINDELHRTRHQLLSVKEERQGIIDFAGEKEKTISRLKSQLTLERIACLGIFALLLLGYIAEYLILKKKFLLFK